MLLFLTFLLIGWGLTIGAFAMMRHMRDAKRHRGMAQLSRDIHAMQEPAWICNADGQVLFQNHPSLEESGQLTGRSIDLYIGRYRADPAFARLAWSAEATRNGSADVRLHDDAMIGIRRSGPMDSYLWRIVRDTDRSEQKALSPFTMTDFEVVPAALLILTADGYVIRANAAARRLLSDVVSFDPSCQMQLGDLFDSPGRSNKNWVEGFLSGPLKCRTEILRLRHQSGTSDNAPDRYVQIVLSHAASEQPGFIAALTDASELKTLEAQFVQSQKMQAIGQLAGGIAHDFNNLLTAMRGHCDLLMLRYDNTDPEYADLEQIRQNTNRASALVGQLLSFSRKQTLKLEILDLRDILADLTHLLNRLVGERAALHISHQPSLQAIYADRRLLEQVMVNLVVNARDAMPDGGEISLATANVTLDEPIIGRGQTVPSGDYACITVTDTGSGIARENIDKIFEPFFTTKPVGEGTGLGLSTVYGIITQTGGYVLCDSEPGQGTCFTIYLPAQTGMPVTQPPLQQEPRLAFPERSATILLAEDEASVRAVATRALRLRGYDVHEVEGGEDALAMLEDGAFCPDLFVSDVVMPGLDGPSWVAEALKLRPGTRVVFMSGYSEDVFVDGKLPVPHSVFLAKPFSLAELVEVVQKQVEDAATSSQDPPMPT